MKAFWDSSALIATFYEKAPRELLRTNRGVTRRHALAEVFSTLTGSRLGFRVDPSEAANGIKQLASCLEVVDLETERLLELLAQARSKGVRGGRVYDYLHAAAAQDADCDHIYTLNPKDFEGLFPDLLILPPN